MPAGAQGRSPALRDPPGGRCRHDRPAGRSSPTGRSCSGAAPAGRAGPRTRCSARPRATCSCCPRPARACGAGRPGHHARRACSRHEVASGAIDGRVLAVLAFLSRSGLKPTVSALRCGRSLMTPPATCLQRHAGDAVDIVAINGIPIAGHQGAGTITDLTIRTLLTLPGAVRAPRDRQPDALPGRPEHARRAPAYGNHIHLVFRPPAAARRAAGSAPPHAAAHSAQLRPTAPAPLVTTSALSAAQWNQLMHARGGAADADGRHQAELRRDSRSPERPRARPRPRRPPWPGVGSSSGGSPPAARAPPKAEPAPAGAPPGRSVHRPLHPPPRRAGRRRQIAAALGLGRAGTARWRCSMPLVLKTGPLPEVFGAGTLMPFSRMHAANFVSACLKAGLLKPRRSAAPGKWPPPPHFFIAASYCARVTPLGSLGPPAPPAAEKAACTAGPPGDRWPGVAFRQRDAVLLQAFAQRLEARRARSRGARARRAGGRSRGGRAGASWRSCSRSRRMPPARGWRAGV